MAKMSVSIGILEKINEDLDSGFYWQKEKNKYEVFRGKFENLY